MRGSVLVEAVLALSFVFVPVVALQLEMARIVWNRVLLHASVFHYVRHRGLGSSKRESLEATRGLQAILLLPERRQARSLDHWDDGRYLSQHQVWARVQVRTQTWFPFLQKQVQVTETCRFLW